MTEKTAEPHEKKLDLQILPQPTETTCGPSCLHAVYAYYGDVIPLEQVVREVETLDSGGTLAVFLACHALRRGYSAEIFTYNLTVFDPTWFARGGPSLRERLIAQMKTKDIPKLHTATRGYLEFLELGGRIRYEDLSRSLIRKYLNRSVPVLTGLSSTYLYRSSREVGEKGEEDDVEGEATGHFVVLCGYNREERTVLVADPFLPNPVAGKLKYRVHIDRVLGAILLGVLTYDANFLIIRPVVPIREGDHAHTDRRK